MTNYNETLNKQSDQKVADIFKDMNLSHFFELLDEHIKERIVKGDFDEVVEARIVIRKGRTVIA